MTTAEQIRLAKAHLRSLERRERIEIAEREAKARKVYQAYYKLTLCDTLVRWLDGSVSDFELQQLVKYALK